MQYQNPAIIDQRKALVETLLNRPCLSRWQWENGQEKRIAEAVLERLPVRKFGLSECECVYDRVWAADLSTAMQIARDNFDESNYDRSHTGWIDVGAQDLVSGDSEYDTMTIEPTEPECEEDHSHDWQTPYSVLGGCRENPGVWGHGGGVIIKEVCRHCAAYKVTDTWAQRPDNGEQGLLAVSYEDPDDRSRAWVAELAEAA
jgi:hypothetical protein